MPGPLLILRAYKIKRAADRLLKAKENALRIHRGQRPRYPWYEECWSWTVQCCRNFFCRAFCPCCVSRDSMSEKYSENFLRRLCMSGTFESYIIKSFLGFIFGVILTLGIFLFFVNQLNCDPRVTTAFCCILGLFLTLGLAFSDQARCIALLVIPELFSNRGRVALLAYAYILVMSGPTKNAVRNANLLVESINCGQELLANQTKAIMKSIFAPLVAVIDTMRDVIDALKDFARQMKEVFIAIRDLFLEIISAIKHMFGWILSIVKVCSSKYGSPYERCKKTFDDAIEDCRYRMGILSFLCEIVTAVKFVCEVARIVDLLCVIPRLIKSGVIEPLKDQVKAFARYMRNQFYVNVTLSHYYNYSFEQSKTYKEIRGDIMQEIHERTAWLNSIIDWSDFAMTFFILFIVFKAFVYRFRYLSADYFDNLYVTHFVRDIDDRRAGLGKETILPLTLREKRKYIHTFSVLMGKKEKKKLMVSGTVLIISGIQMAFYLLLDYSLFNLLEMIRFHGKVQAKTGVPTHVTVNVKGEGILADMYRQMITSFDPVMGSIPDFDTTQCLPTAIPVDLDRYQQIVIMYSLCVILTLTEAYGLRFRHVVCSIYYPAQERARAVWLYNHILKTRGGLIKFLRRKIRRKFYDDDSIEKVSLVDWLSNQFLWFGLIMKAFGYVRIYCICCNEAGKPEDDENFKRCSTAGCKGIYCIACFDDINNLCTLCMKPVDYGDISDISEERDSSEEELRVCETRTEEASSTDDQFEEQLPSDSEDNERLHFRDVETQKKRELATLSDF